MRDFRTALAVFSALATLSGCIKERVETQRYLVSVTEGMAFRSERLDLERLEEVGLSRIETSFPHGGKRYEGVRLVDLALKMGASRRADTVVLSCADGYRAIVPLSVARAGDLSLITRINGRPPQRFKKWRGSPLGLYAAFPNKKYPDFDKDEFRFFWATQVIAIDFVRFEDYFARSLARQASRPIREGRDLFVRNCVSCHQAEGPGGLLGPDLVATFSDQTPERFVSYVLRPKDSNAKTRMPGFEGHLTAEDLERLFAYLGHLHGRFGKTP